jgi:hypothetical protein
MDMTKETIKAEGCTLLLDLSGFSSSINVI